MALSSMLAICASADLKTALDLGPASASASVARSVVLGSGTGAGKADKVFHDRRTLAASASEDLDLAGALVDAFGQTITLARVKGLVISASADNVNNLTVGAASGSPWATLLGATHTMTLRPGATFAVMAGQADATAYAVTASTGDLLKVANSGAGSAVQYDVVIIGASA
ncbi:hypothetical protein GCM10011583_11980 [Streptomyces camponoticapitis]|uniref:PLAT domain-containing protein n=1 Tax=Streptomyces camponoticapitis TaxID=1616125 RepID=A0ABQ2DZJ2_9ACTN|nr:hypothetical protein [Streptomyces camponoticapitis]GGJ82045.1 hypothetical protein GCM10011583_11980 [Streptomyces camponoticapitis]